MKSGRLIAPLAFLGALGVWVAGCGTDPSRELTQDEAMMVARLMGGSVVGPTVDETLGSTPFWDLADTRDWTHDTRDWTHEREVDREVDCPEGGTATLSGNFDIRIDLSGLHADAEGSVAFDACADRAEDEVLIEVTGGIDFEGEVEATADLDDQMAYASIEGSAEGSVDWEIEEEGESGTCEVDVALDVDVEVDFEDGDIGDPVVEGGVTGTVCGHVIDFDAADLEF